MECNKWSKKGGSTYQQRLYGVLSNGQKAKLILEGIQPYFDIEVPDDQTVDWNAGGELRSTDVSKRAAVLRNDIEDALGRTLVKSRIIMAKPLQGFTKEPKPYIRLYFNNLKDRKAGLNWAEQEGYAIFSNDPSSYYRKVARETKMTMAGWNYVSEYEEVDEEDEDASEDIKTFRVDIRNIREVPQEDKTPMDPSLELCWDIETMGNEQKNFGVKTDKDGGKVFAICVAICRVSQKKPLCTIGLTRYDCEIPDLAETEEILREIGKEGDGTYDDISAEETSRALRAIEKKGEKSREFDYIVKCQNEKDLILTFAKVINRFKPEYIVDFNGHNYDWPFIIWRVINRYRIEEQFMKLVSCEPVPEDQRKWTWSGMDLEKTEEIKLEAGRNTNAVFVKAPGFIPVDARVQYMTMQEYKTKEKSSLNFYLSENGLDSKDHMPIPWMWTICRKLEKLIKQNEQDDDPVHPDIMRRWKLLMFYVLKYCLIDSVRCHDLLIKRTVVVDKRGVAKMTYISMYDAFFRADGMKVVNAISGYTYKKDPNYFTTPYDPDYIPKDLILINHRRRDTGGAKVKFQGAFVLQPKKGIYTDRPCGGLDFGSLYPNIIRSSALSPENIITDLEVAREICGALNDNLIKKRKAKPDATTAQNFPYNRWFRLQKHVVEWAERTFIAWTILPPADDNNMVDKEYVKWHGLFPRVLGDIFDVRLRMKLRVAQLKGEVEKLEVEMKAAEEAGDEELAKKLAHKLEELELERNIVDSQQKAAKVLMNSFYGEAGNQSSCLFNIMISGTTTMRGRTYLKTMYRYLIDEHHCKIQYGDTDSLYVVCREEIFREIDRKYQSGEIDKMTYWSEMVTLSMRELDRVKKAVKGRLIEITGYGFLEMAYEEILFPYCLIARKKYFGLEHLGVPNFTKPKQFIKGLDFKKRGASPMLKMVCQSILDTALSMDCSKTLKQIVEDKLVEIKTTDWSNNIDLFAKMDTCKQKRDEEGKVVDVKNVKAQTFKARMEEEAKYNPDIEPPKIFQRFEYVVVEKPAFTYNFKGKSTKTALGDKFEYLSRVKANPHLFKIDLDYYIEREIIGKLSGFIAYDDEFTKGLEQPDPNDTEANNKYNKKLMDKAKKYLLEFFRTKFGNSAVNHHTLRKKVYRECLKIVKNKHADKDTLGVLQRLSAYDPDHNLGDDPVKEMKAALLEAIKEEKREYLTQEHRTRFAKRLRRKFMSDGLDAIVAYKFFSGKNNNSKGARKGNGSGSRTIGHFPRYYNDALREIHVATAEMERSLAELVPYCQATQRDLQSIIRGATIDVEKKIVTIPDEADKAITDIPENIAAAMLNIDACYQKILLKKIMIRKYKIEKSVLKVLRGEQTNDEIEVVISQKKEKKKREDFFENNLKGKSYYSATENLSKSKFGF
ncbi:Archaeal DNA polymerase I [Kaumoebavirus]|uniref:Archaeal DNA polymerase I n=1 Tax=Kaumoebavirus TaxID=1859492 RepID=UPI0009C1AFD2|nr:Archaeal DNA polymerase I [Kaumoebavirus]ARA71927.1 Archaeal DNA polymerase I [Kaumoebavirus]